MPIGANTTAPWTVPSASPAVGVSTSHDAPTPIGTRSNNVLRVVHVSLGTQVGGMEKLLVDWARFHDQDQVAMSFVSLQCRGALADVIESQGCDVIDFAKRPGLRPGLIWRLARYLRTQKVDLVHTHNTAALFYGSAAAKLARVSTVVHTRHGQRYGASKRETWMLRQASRIVDAMVSVCDDGTRCTIEEGVRTDVAKTIVNGIDLTRFTMAGPKKGGPATLVARLSIEKSVETLVEAMAWVKQRQCTLEDPLKLRIVGDGDCRSSLEEMIRRLDLCDRIEMVGQRDDVHHWLRDASMFVLPSVTEGISLTLLEAMARGLPVVATAVGGTPEIVTDNVNGCLVPPRDPRSLADAMLRIHRDSDGARQMGRRGRQLVEQNHDIRLMVDRYQDLYQSLVRRQR